MAATTCAEVVGKFVSLEGNINLERADAPERQPAALDTALCQNDMIHVGANSRAAIALINEAVLRIDQNSTLRLADIAGQPKKSSLLELIIGSFKSFSRPPRKFAVNTPYLNGVIEGTEFAMRVNADSATTTVYEGKVTTKNEFGSLSLKRGETALAHAGQAPKPYQLVKPRDAVQWTLHYPALFSLGGGQANSRLNPALQRAAQGDTPGALSLLEQIPPAERDADYHLYRAALALDVGRAEQARADIDATLSLNPNAGLAYALRAIMAVVNNDHPAALADAQKAVALSPSAAAKIALSYVQQAAFQLDAARDTLLAAVSEHPDDALAQARLAELWLMSGEKAKALAAAHQAETLAPNLARTQAVLGFAALAGNDETDARQAFQRAIALDSADPLAHFGLGLAKIKHGDLTQGRGELEIAVALDANNALLRSYLGKAYFEERRMPLDSQQYEIAAELDPADPTPYFYDAIDKQTTNRPVEAMQSLSKAIQLNDNRQVYRSRQMLDSDMAARSAGMGRVYSDLGFQELALRQGWKSVNIDPANYSAHRFLADSYSVLPRNEISRVSELLQSQLLQPLNMTPIQPHLGESNLLLISAGGPGGMSFNEFNPIYNRNGLAFQSNDLLGGNGTSGQEQIVSGLRDNVSFSMGYTQFHSAGWRDNSSQKDAIGNAFVQMELSPQTSIQAEYRYRYLKTGDLDMRYLNGDFRNNYSQNELSNTGRFGLKHSFNPNSTLLGSFIYQNRDTGQQNYPTNSFITSINDQFPNQKAYSGELQHLYTSTPINVTSGAGFFDINGWHQQSFGFDPTLGLSPLINRAPESSKHVNLYLYTYINLIKNLTVNIGGSGDFYHTDSLTTKSANQFNPKFGLTWNVLPDTTFRAAAFRVLKRTLTTDQTLEPTQLAGFNQFYDDINATDTWRISGAIDQKFSQSLFGGVEFSKRYVNTPYQSVDANTGLSSVLRGNGDEYLGRAYLYWTPSNWAALNAEYQKETFNNNPSVAFDYTSLNTDRYSMGFKLFSDTGFSTALQASYYNQKGNFTPRDTACCSFGESNFWLVDTSVSYRLPKRYGILKLGANNLLNQNFQYFDTNRGTNNMNPLIIPDRVVYGSVTLAFQGM